MQDLKGRQPLWRGGTGGRPSGCWTSSPQFASAAWRSIAISTRTPPPSIPLQRVYGAFGRILGHFTRDLPLLTLPQAIHKMTGGPAAALRLVDRGVLRPGTAADITVFDPCTIAERATHEAPRQYPAGISHVIVNGVIVVDASRHTGVLPGRVLRRTAAGVA